MTFDEEIQGPLDRIHDIIQFSCLDVRIPELQYTPGQGGDGPGLGEVKLDVITGVIPASCQILTIRTTVTWSNHNVYILSRPIISSCIYSV